MIPRFFLIASAMLLASCGSSLQSHYALKANGPTPSTQGVGIGVGPVDLAEYIDRPNLIVEESPQDFQAASHHRWAGDLESQIANTTASNLGRRLNTGNVHRYPWQGNHQLRYQVTLDLRQFHSSADGFAVIEAGWRIYSLPDHQLLTTRTFIDREALAKDGYPALIDAQSTLLSRLADEIAKTLK